MTKPTCRVCGRELEPIAWCRLDEHEATAVSSYGAVLHEDGYWTTILGDELACSGLHTEVLRHAIRCREGLPDEHRRLWPFEIALEGAEGRALLEPGAVYHVKWAAPTSSGGYERATFLRRHENDYYEFDVCQLGPSAGHSWHAVRLPDSKPLKTPRWTVLYDTVTADSPWTGSGAEFFDDEQAALVRYSLIPEDREKAGPFYTGPVCATARPWHKSDWRWLAAAHGRPTLAEARVAAP